MIFPPDPRCRWSGGPQQWPWLCTWPHHSQWKDPGPGEVEPNVTADNVSSQCDLTCYQCVVIYLSAWNVLLCCPFFSVLAFIWTRMEISFWGKCATANSCNASLKERCSLQQQLFEDASFDWCPRNQKLQGLMLHSIGKLSSVSSYKQQDRDSWQFMFLSARHEMLEGCKMDLSHTVLWLEGIWRGNIQDNSCHPRLRMGNLPLLKLEPTAWLN